MNPRGFYNIVTADIETVAAFYERLLGLRRRFTSGWFIHLGPPEAESFELGILQEGHSMLPPGASTSTGGMLTFVVDDVEVVYRRAEEAGVPIVEAPRDMFYGQRRLVVKDPAGTLVDVSSECPPDPEWMAKVRPSAGGGFEEA